MRVYTFFVAFMLLASIAPGQNRLTYHFNNSLAEENGQGPELSTLGNQGTFMEDALLEIGSAEKWVYRFEQNSGLQFDNTDFFQDSYTIEVYFVFDNLSSWKRVIDWKNRKSDGGAYVYNGELNFYPFVYSEEAPVVPGEYTYYVVTRDASTQKVVLYADGESEAFFIDDQGKALVDADNVLNFFQDDLVVANEASSGAVAMLRLYDYALDSNAVKQNFENLGSNVFSVRDPQKRSVNMGVYPNPVSSLANVDLSGFAGEGEMELKIQNILGQPVFEQSLNQGNLPTLRVDLSNLTKGMYFLRVESKTKLSTAKLMVQ